jgi:hypothetical protein
MKGRFPKKSTNATITSPATPIFQVEPAQQSVELGAVQFDALLTFLSHRLRNSLLQPLSRATDGRAGNVFIGTELVDTQTARLATGQTFLPIETFIKTGRRVGSRSRPARWLASSSREHGNLSPIHGVQKVSCEDCTCVSYTAIPRDRKRQGLPLIVIGRIRYDGE